jgi:hypothetical protein
MEVETDEELLNGTSVFAKLAGGMTQRPRLLITDHGCLLQDMEDMLCRVARVEGPG